MMLMAKKIISKQDINPRYCFPPNVDVPFLSLDNGKYLITRVCSDPLHCSPDFSSSGRVKTAGANPFSKHFAVYLSDREIQREVIALEFLVMSELLCGVNELMIMILEMKYC